MAVLVSRSHVAAGDRPAGDPSDLRPRYFRLLTGWVEADFGFPMTTLLIRGLHARAGARRGRIAVVSRLTFRPEMLRWLRGSTATLGSMSRSDGTESGDHTPLLDGYARRASDFGWSPAWAIGSTRAATRAGARPVRAFLAAGTEQRD